MRRSTRTWVLLLAMVASGCAGSTESPSDPAAGWVGGAFGGHVPSGSVGRCRRYRPLPSYATCLMSAPQNVPRGSPLKPLDTASLPAKVDHRQEYLASCLAVHSQGSCGWCTAHATTAALEALHCQQKLGPRRVSEPHLWYLGRERGEIQDCEGGWYISSAFYELALATGQGSLLVKGSQWPYSDQVAQLNADRPSDADLKSYGRYGAAWGTMLSVPATDIVALKAALASGMNVAYSVPTFKATGWSWEDPTYGTVVAPSPEPAGACDCETCPDEPHCLEGYHAVLIVGYDDATARFLFLNSWSEGWGDAGYGSIAYDVVGQHGNGGWATSALTIAKLADQPPAAVLRYQTATPSGPEDYPYDGVSPAPAISVGSTIHLSSALSADPEHEKITRELTVTAPDGWGVWLDAP
ncbi:MAG: C1 family peptidase, partial [Acidobacteriota bacterium]